MAGESTGPLCQIFLLGSLSVTSANGLPCTPKSQKARALVAMLALAPRGVRSRVWLRDKLWSDRGEGQAAASLRQALVDVRKSLRPHADRLLNSDKHTISLDLGRIKVDALELLDAAARDEAAAVATAGSCPDFLEGLDIGDPEFEEWLTLERQVWKSRFENALMRQGVSSGDHGTRSVPAAAAERRAGSDSHDRHTNGKAPGRGRTPEWPEWGVALMPSVVTGDREDMRALADVVTEVMVKSLLESGEMSVSDFSRSDVGATSNSSGGAVLGPIRLVIQPSYRFSAHHVHFSICVKRTRDQSLLWMGGATFDCRAVEAGDTSASHQLINEVMDRLRIYFLHRSKMPRSEGWVESESLYGAIDAMFRLSQDHLALSEASLRHIISEHPSSQAYAWLAFLMTFRVGQSFADLAATIDQAQHFGRKALELDAGNAMSLALVGHVHSFLFGEYDFASGMFERAIRANPAQILAWDLYSMLHAYAGQPEKGLSLASWAQHLGSHSPYRFYFDTSKCINAARSGNYKVAIEAGEQALRERPDLNSLLRSFIANHANQGEIRAARSLLHRLNVTDRDLSMGPLINPHPTADNEGGANLIEGLVKAGVNK